MINLLVLRLHEWRINKQRENLTKAQFKEWGKTDGSPQREKSKLVIFFSMGIMNMWTSRKKHKQMKKYALRIGTIFETDILFLCSGYGG